MRLFSVLPPGKEKSKWDRILRRKYEVDIYLDQLEMPVIDFSKYDKEFIVLSGSYAGDRIRFRNAQGKKIHFQDAYIESYHAEDAIVFEQGHGENFTLEGDDKSTITGAITFWGKAAFVTIKNIIFDGGWVGIRATQPLSHQHIKVTNCIFRNISLEAVYFGPSYVHANKCSHIIIKENKFFVIGWDAIQVGNTQSFIIEGNFISHAGYLKEYGQDYGITINPGSLGYIVDNTIVNTPKPIQVLDSRAFFHTNKA